MKLSSAQLEIARKIVTVGQRLNVSAKLVRAALSTGWVESRLTNITRAVDHDSLGVFQQRPSVGEWGTAQQILDVEHAAERFYRTALRMDRPNLTAGQLAAKVQRPAKQYAGRYEEQLPTADTLLARLESTGMDVANYTRKNPGTTAGAVIGVIFAALALNWFVNG
jgi:hypothetical protein